MSEPSYEVTSQPEKSFNLLGLPYELQLAMLETLPTQELLGLRRVNKGSKNFVDDSLHATRETKMVGCATVEMHTKAMPIYEQLWPGVTYADFAVDCPKPGVFNTEAALNDALGDFVITIDRHYLTTLGVEADTAAADALSLSAMVETMSIN
ncbi:hypothetical protein BJ085DRAFT_35005 [Dimargaris cristalligena]|uniref:F-box domain-containing protein n=1 Tax=Dimargaris cristalligena TaxID=215637 RepID=A0A4V1J419_9FUNG|nr:hypothetical protein BJ085DRAFT_35005 [Dimargaris cristalligena]|eukprot:RKP34019.1 hypothetical protein BJ085DRAFT_35005 [Dimargaris cristalligena]